MGRVSGRVRGREGAEEEEEEGEHLHLLLQVIAGDGGLAVGEGLGGSREEESNDS